MESRVRTRRSAPALFGGLDDDVTALEVNRLAAPGGGHEQLRSLVDIHHRSVGEPQHRVGSRAGADRLVLSDRGACFERALRLRAARFGGQVGGQDRQAVQPTVGGNDRGPRAAGSHHAVDGVASEIKDREEQCRRRGQGSPSHPAGGGAAFVKATAGQASWHGDDRPLALHFGDPGATARAAAEMIFHEDATAAAQLISQIRVEILPELRTRGAAGVRHLLPDAHPRGLERAGVHVFLFHFL